MSTLQTRPPGDRVGFVTAIVAVGALVAFMWVLEAYDYATSHSLDDNGIEPRTSEGIVGIVVAPWLHHGWGHLISNSVPFLALGTLALLDGWRRWLWATVTIVLASGLTVWLFSPDNSITAGASGVVFGWLTYLLVRGFYSGSFAQVGIGLVVFLVYGGILWGVLPGDAGISWQGHLGGAVGGVLAARWLHRAPSGP